MAPAAVAGTRSRGAAHVGWPSSSPRGAAESRPRHPAAQSRQKAKATATSVPRWSATSNAGAASAKAHQERHDDAGGPKLLISRTRPRPAVPTARKASAVHSGAVTALTERGSGGVRAAASFPSPGRLHPCRLGRRRRSRRPHRGGTRISARRRLRFATACTRWCARRRLRSCRPGPAWSSPLRRSPARLGDRVRPRRRAAGPGRGAPRPRRERRVLRPDHRLARGRGLLLRLSPVGRP